MIRIAKSIALFVTSSIFAVLLAETLFHFFPGVLPIEVHQAFTNKGAAHAEIGNLPEPGASGVIVTRDFASPYHLDNKGFRNERNWPERPDIAAIGDSLVFGYGVDAESAWPQILSDTVDKSVVNLGLIGASPQQYRKIHETFVRPLKPEIAVVGFFARNDFWDAGRYDAWERSGVGGNYLKWRGFGMPTADQYDSLSYRVLFELRQRSYVLALVKFARDALSGKRSSEPTVLTTADGSEMMLHSEDFRRKTQLSEPDNEIFELVVDQLRQIHDAAMRDGTRLIVLLQPAKEEVYREAENASLPDASNALRAELDQLGIEYVDAAPVFRELAQDGAALYFSIDGHPNEAGYKVLAELMADYLNAADDVRQGSSSEPDH